MSDEAMSDEALRESIRAQYRPRQVPDGTLYSKVCEGSGAFVGDGSPGEAAECPRCRRAIGVRFGRVARHYRKAVLVKRGPITAEDRDFHD